MATAAAARGGVGAGLLNVSEQPGVAVPPPPPPQMKPNERCFRSRMRELRLVYLDREKVANGTVSIPAERRAVEFKPHVTGLFGEIVTSDPDMIRVLRAATGELCQKHDCPLSECDPRWCKPLVPIGDVWEAAQQVKQYEDQRAAQLQAELAGNPALLQRVVAGLGQAADAFELPEAESKPNKAARRERKADAKAEAAPPESEGLAGDGAAFDLRS